MLITSKDNNRIKEIAKLKQKKYRDLTNTYLVEGIHLVSEGIKAGRVIEVVTTLEEDTYEVNTLYVTKEVMRQLTDMDSVPSVIGVARKYEDKLGEGNILVLDGIQDPGNLGTIIRSAVAFNMPNIFISNNSCDLYNPKVIRSTEGMISHVNIKRGDILEFLDSIKGKYLILGTDVRDGVDIKDVKIDKNIALVIGSEGQGMSLEVRKRVDKNVYIKMNNKCESLNAGVSCSIILYEVNHE